MDSYKIFTDKEEQCTTEEKLKSRYPDGLARIGALIGRKTMTRIEEIQADINIDRLAEICEAEREGRLVVLPCKVGDKVFITNLLKYGKQYYFKNYYFNFNGEIIMNIYDRFEKENYPIKLNDFGKTVFLTRAEAEKARAEMEVNNENNNN